jgi:hypothetical protein
MRLWRTLGAARAGGRATARRNWALAALAAVVGCGSTAPATQALTPSSAAIQPSFRPYRTGASTAFTLAMSFAGGPEHVPAPLRRIVLRLPAGLSISLAGVPVCARSRLRSGGCPADSLLGRGRALLKVHAGSQTLPEQATVSIYRGPSQGPNPTFEIVGQGETPLDERTVSTALLQPDTAPYGSRLTVSIPPIPTLVYEPDASFSSLSLTIGNVGARAGRLVAVPRSCPSGGLPFTSTFTFADASVASSSARLACP